MATTMKTKGVDPIKLAKLLWPDVHFYKEQREIIYSVWDNDLTAVPAGHMLGKDFVSGALILLFFLTRSPCRIVTTSVDKAQLEGVLWGEIRRFIQSSAIPLTKEKGGPLIINHLHLRKLVKGEPCGLSYVIGRVAAKGEGMSGHHVAKTGDGVPRALFVADECSGMDEETIEKASEWWHRAILIGNPYPCENRFRWSVEGRPGTDDRGGDLLRQNAAGYERRVIRIPATASPNVRLAQAEIAAGKAPSGKILVPGVLPYEDYVKRLRDWDVIKQCAGLGADWYKGAELLMFPPTWLNHSEQLAAKLGSASRRALAIGVDTGEGVADTSFAAVDRHGLIDLESVKTPDTNVIPGLTLAFARKHGVPPECILFDRGGGGKHHADRLRAMGYNVRTVAFGEAVQPDVTPGRKTAPLRAGERESRTEYVNMRASLYGELRELLDPSGENGGWAIPARYTELRRQLAPIPLTYDGEGRLYVLPKNKKDPNSKQPTLTQLIGRSPDDADAVVLACHQMLHPLRRAVAGVM